MTRSKQQTLSHLEREILERLNEVRATQRLVRQVPDNRRDVGVEPDGRFQDFGPFHPIATNEL